MMFVAKDRRINSNNTNRLPLCPLLLHVACKFKFLQRPPVRCSCLQSLTHAAMMKKMPYDYDKENGGLLSLPSVTCCSLHVAILQCSGTCRFEQDWTRVRRTGG